jgi:hypothetical protein
MGVCHNQSWVVAFVIIVGDTRSGQREKPVLSFTIIMLIQWNLIISQLVQIQEILM